MQATSNLSQYQPANPETRETSVTTGVLITSHWQPLFVLRRTNPKSLKAKVSNLRWDFCQEESQPLSVPFSPSLRPLLGTFKPKGILTLLIWQTMQMRCC